VIKGRLAQADTKQVLKRMGYNSMKNGMNTLNQFLACTDCFTWLSSSNYDFHCTSKEFLEKLCTALDVEPKLYQDAISNYAQIEDELRKTRGCYVFVDTNFRRTTQPIFALAFMEGSRRLSPDKKSIMFKTKKHILKSISKMVRKHYLANNGELQMWGKIENYVYHHFDGKQYVFDSNGCLLENAKEVFESRATLFLK
jgi:hypothetical protein